MNKPIELDTLRNLFNNHTMNQNLPIQTQSVVIDRTEFDRFNTKARNTQGCDGIKIYFIRHDLNLDQGHIKKVPGENLSQLTLAFVPARITDRDNWIAEHIPEQDNINIFTLLVCEPIVPDTRTTPNDPSPPQNPNDQTGMCPPKGNCPIL